MLYFARVELARRAGVFMAGTLLRPTDAARYLGLSPATLRAYRARGIAPVAIVVGSRAVAYEIHELDSWLARRKERFVITGERKTLLGIGERKTLLGMSARQLVSASEV